MTDSVKLNQLQCRAAHVNPLLPLPGSVAQKRVPSGMLGEKSDIWEGSIRNFLAVRGPGVARGVIDSTLTDLTDILPTIADLAGIDPAASTHLPWDGISLKNLLLPRTSASRPGSRTASKGAGGARATARQGLMHRGTRLASAAQLDRFLVTLSPSCWHANVVPDLGTDRWDCGHAQIKHTTDVGCPRSLHAGTRRVV